MKKEILSSVCIVIMTLTISFAQIGQFEKSEDIGNPKFKGSSSYDSSSQTYTLRGGGENIWFNHDEFQFLYKRIKGDFLLTANFQLIGNESGAGHRKTGWMIRESTQDNSVSVNSCLHGDGLVVIQWRPLRGAYMRDPEEEIFWAKQYFGENIIQLERIGKKITMRIAHPGEAFEEMGSVDLPTLRDEVLVGPYALAHDGVGIQEANVWNVRISTPVAPDWHPNHYMQMISHDSIHLTNKIEVVNVATNKSKVIYETMDEISAPMYSKNGKEIIFKKGNEYYTVNPSGNGQPKMLSGAIAQMDTLEKDDRYQYFNTVKSGTNQLWKRNLVTQEETQITYGHEQAWYPHISPDKKSIAYLALPFTANPSKPVKYQNAMIKVMPLAGGESKAVSYFYGGKGSMNAYSWSANGNELVFVSNGMR